MKLTKSETREILKELKKRRKIVWVKDHEVCSLFIAASVAIGSIKTDRMNLVLPVIKELPDGAFIDSVFFDPVNSCFGIVVLHDMFPVVAAGETPEFLNGTLETEYVHAIIEGRQIIGGRLN
jgi:hypothetical protein